MRDGTLQINGVAWDFDDCHACPSAYFHRAYRLDDGRFVSARTPGLPADAALTADGLGSLTIGATCAEAAYTLNMTDYLFTDGECVEGSFVDWPDALFLMGSHGHITFIQVTDDSHRTPEGLGVGSLREQVTAAYPGRLRATPHVYWPDGEYLTVEPADDSPNRLLFELDEGVVVAVRVGLAGWVDAPEGCA